jgi:hypothetical protein
MQKQMNNVKELIDDNSSSMKSNQDIYDNGMNRKEMHDANMQPKTAD